MADEAAKVAALEAFTKLGLDERTAQTTLKNSKLTATLLDVIQEV